MILEKQTWKTVKFSDICHDIEYGITASSQDFGETVFLRITDIDEYGKVNGPFKYTDVDEHDFTKFGLHKDDVLIARSGATAGKPYIHKFSERSVFGSYLLRLRLKKEVIYPDYVFAFLFSDNYLRQLKTIKVGGAQPNVNTVNLKSLKIPLPSLEEQKKIVDLFMSLEKCIVFEEKQDKNLLELKNQLLRDLFGENKQFGTFLTDKDFEKVRFEKIALNISERVEPKQTELAIYVGLEHLDSDDLIIRRKGRPDDVIGTKLKIFTGDIIFGKRRAYLRKISVADFDGIVSAHSMVLRAIEQNIEREFLPYFMQSDEFMKRAVQISEGSLSPTIKWKTLAQQEFYLPQKEKQVYLLEVFKQFDASREQLRTQIHTLKTLKQKLLNEIIG